MLGINTLYKAAMRCSEEEDYNNNQVVPLFAWRFHYVFFFLFKLLSHHIFYQNKAREKNQASVLEKIIRGVFAFSFILALPIYLLGALLWMCINALGTCLLVISFCFPGHSSGSAPFGLQCTRWSLYYFFLCLAAFMLRFLQLIVHFLVAILFKYLLVIISIVLDVLVNTLCAPLQTILFFICDVSTSFRLNIVKIVVFLSCLAVGGLLCVVGLSLYGLLPKIWLATCLLILPKCLLAWGGVGCADAMLLVLGVCVWIASLYGLRVVALRLSMDSVSYVSDVLILNRYEQASDLYNGEYATLEEVAQSLIIIDEQAQARLVSFIHPR